MRAKKGVHDDTLTMIYCQFKAQVVLELISGAKSAAVICRQHQLSLQVLARWKAEFLIPYFFAQEEEQQAEHVGIDELKYLVGRLTMELVIAKKASAILSSASNRNGRS